MIKKNNSEIWSALMAFQNSQAILIEYEKTKKPELLPKIRSIKDDCQHAIDTWLLKLHSIDDASPIRPVLLMALSMIYRMLGGAHMYLTEYTNAKSCYKSAIELGEELGETSEVVQSLNNLGLIEMEQHNPADAAKFFRMAIDRLDNKTDRDFGATIKKNLKIAESTIE